MALFSMHIARFTFCLCTASVSACIAKHPFFRGPPVCALK